MENRFISMFGFQVKKEYVLNKIKEHLNIHEEIDYDNPPEVFKETIEEYFSIECLNAFVPHLILRQLRIKLFELNLELRPDKIINMVCKPSGELYIGYVKIEDFVDSNNFHNHFDNSLSFNQTLITQLLEEVKLFIGLENIGNEINDYTVGVYHNIEEKGTKFLFEMVYSLG